MVSIRTWKRILIASFIILFSIPLILVGCFFVSVTTQYLYGYVDNTGQFVIPPRFSTAENFENGQARVGISDQNLVECIGTQMYQIDHQGHLIGQSGFDSGNCYAGDSRFFSSDFPAYTEGSELYPMPTIDEESANKRILKYGYKNKNHKWLIPPGFSGAGFFNNNVAWVQGFYGNEHNWGLINKKGEYILPPKCYSAGAFHEGLAKCRVKVYLGLFY